MQRTTYRYWMKQALTVPGPCTRLKAQQTSGEWVTYAQSVSARGSRPTKLFTSLITSSNQRFVPAQQNVKALATPEQMPAPYTVPLYIIDCKYVPLQDKLEAAFCMFWRLLSYKEFYKIHSCLSHNLRSELYHRIGLTDLLDLRMPMGHYRLDMRMRVQNCAAHLLQVLHLPPVLAWHDARYLVFSSLAPNGTRQLNKLFAFPVLVAQGSRGGGLRRRTSPLLEECPARRQVCDSKNRQPSAVFRGHRARFCQPPGSRLD